MIPSNKAGDLVYTFAYHLTNIIENEILDKGRYLIEPDRFFYTVLHKLRNILDATSFLIKNLDEKPHYYDSTYLLLRTALFDVVSLYFIMDAEKDSALKNNRIERIMYDHVRSLWGCAQDDVERQLIKKEFSQCFLDGKFRKDIIKVNIILMHDEIRKQIIKDEVRSTINFYNIFSKVEHNGLLTFNLLHAHFEAEGAERAKTKVYGALKIIMSAISLLLAYAWEIRGDDERFMELIRTNKELVV